MILAILQARVSSSRLPNKVLAPLLGRPMLHRQLERLQKVKKFDQLCVATSLDASDHPLLELCKSAEVPCFQGSLNDVLDRFYQCALPYHPSQVVRLTGDCPLTDPALIDRIIDHHLKTDSDYT